MPDFKPRRSWASRARAQARDAMEPSNYQGKHKEMPLKAPKSPHKVLIWDIESTNLSASFGTILCIGYKWLGKPRVYVPTILDHSGDGRHKMLNDRGLVEAFAQEWEKADMVCTWYGKRFDQPMIETKLLRYKMPPLSPKPHLDLWETAKRKFKMHSNRLQAMQEFLHTSDEKTQIDFDAWLQAAHGYPPAMREVVDHCRQDVLVLEQVYLRMLPWITDIPAVGGLVCPACGSPHVTRQGTHRSKTRLYQRWQCQGCGKWLRDRLSLTDRPRLVPCS